MNKWPCVFIDRWVTNDYCFFFLVPLNKHKSYRMQLKYWHKNETDKCAILANVYINFRVLLTFKFRFRRHLFWVIYCCVLSIYSDNDAYFDLNIWCAIQLNVIHTHRLSVRAVHKEVELDKWDICTICLWVIDVTELKTLKKRSQSNMLNPSIRS